jgi:PAS domain S-box-containing protein
MPVERTTGGTSLIDVLDRVLDKGIVIDAWVRVSLVGIDLITVEARVVVASIDTYIRYSEAVGTMAPAPRIGVEDRLALVEFLNACLDPSEAAQRGLEWLARIAGVAEGLCVVADADRKKLVDVAAYGDAPARLQIDLENQDDPFVAAFALEAPTVIARQTRRRRSLDGAPPLLSIPFRDLDQKPFGLLLISPPSQRVREIGLWLAGALGPTLARAQRRQTLEETERKLRRERSLLYSIINAVSDPILLTDREERIVVANARAEALFGTRESDSEGRRRAVGLNNMLFSAALSRGMFEDIEAVRHELPLVDPQEGEDLLFELIGTPVRDESGEENAVSILRNVTDLRMATTQIQENYDKLRAAEAEVRAERDRLDLIIDSVADPIIATDPEGTVVPRRRWSRACGRTMPTSPPSSRPRS